MLVVGIGHRKGTGKDTFAKFVASYVKLQTRGKAIKVVGFADKLKDVCYQLFAWAGLKPGIYYETDETYEKRNCLLEIPINGEFKSPRDIWIEFGQHSRKYYERIWRDAVLKNTIADLLLIKDLRFFNEIEGVLEVNGLTVKVVNPNVPDTDDEADRPLQDYTSWHHTFVNDSTKEALNVKAQVFARMLIERMGA